MHLRRRLAAFVVSSLVAPLIVVVGASPSQALTVTLGASDLLKFNRSVAGTFNSISGSGNGTSNNDIILYKNVVTVGGIVVDAAVKTVLSGGTISNYDNPGSATSNDDNLQFNASITSAGGSIGVNISFYEGGTYTAPNTGNPVVLQNVRMSALDLDAAGSSDFQFAEFTGFQKYTLNSPTNLGVTRSGSKVRFTGSSNNNNSNIPGDRVLAKYDSMQSIDVTMGNVKVASTNWFAISFDAWTANSMATTSNPIEYTNTYNTPPTSTNTSSYVATGTNYVLPKSIFGTYADVDSNPFNQVMIKSLPASGVLQYLNGSTWTDVTLNQIVTMADIELGKLRFNGSVDTNITFQVHDGLAYSTATYTATFLSVPSAQIITFTNPGTKAPSQTFASGATTDATGLTVTLTSKTPGVCTVSGLNIVTVATGMCEIEATQPGNTTYGAAAPVTQIFPVTSLTSQVITFNNPGTQSVSSGTIASGATTDATGLTVTLTSLTPSVCTVSGLNIVIVGQGYCEIKATQPGNGTYGPAAPVTQKFLVTGVVITITAPNIIRTYGDPIGSVGSPTFSNNFVNGDTSAVLTTQPTCTTTYTPTTDVSTGGTTTCSGAVAANYTFNYVDGTVTINQKQLTVTASSVPQSAGLKYGDPIPTINPSYSGFVNSQGSGVIDTPPTCSTTYTTSSNFGTTPTTSCSGAVDGNYSFTYTGGTVYIAKKVLTVTASSHTASVNDPQPTITASYSGFVSPQTSTVLTTQPTCSTNYSQGNPAGNYVTTCSGGAATNYEFAYIDGTVTVSSNSATAQTITFPNPGNQTYGPGFTLPTPPSSSSGGNPTGLTVIITSNSPSVCTVSGNVVTIVGVGTCSLTANQGGGTSGSTTYNPATPVTITFVVGQATLTITASDITVDYGDGTPNVSYTASGYVLSDNSSVLLVAPVCTTTYTGTEAVAAASSLGTSCSGASANNYQFIYVPGDVLINGAPLTVTASSHNVYVGDTPPTISKTYAGFVNGETSSALTTAPTCSTAYASTSAVGTYSSSCANGNAANYDISYVNGSVTVTDPNPVPSQVITFNTPSNKKYGNDDFTVDPTASSGLPVTLTSDTPDVCTVSGFTITILKAGTCTLTASQPGNQNYFAANDVTRSFTVGKAQLRVTASSRTVTLGAPKPFISASYSGFVRNDSTNDITEADCSTSYSSTSPVGRYGTSCSGARSENYSFTYVDGQITVVAPLASPTPTPSPTVTATPTPTPTPSPTLTPSGQLPTPVLEIPVGPDGKPLADPTSVATIDLGNGIEETSGLKALGVKNGSNQSVRTITQLANETMSGFASGVGTIIEVIGARTTGQFIVANTSTVDSLAISKALEESVARNASEFARVTNAQPLPTVDMKKVIGGVPTEDALDTFKASALENPRTIGQLNVAKATKWIQVTASVETYKPGSVVYLAVTTNPVIFGAGVVDKYGKAEFTGLLPVDALSPGGHNIRVVGIRNLDGVTTDDQGQIQLAQATMDEIQKFDQGTKATVKVIGQNIQGGFHAVLREVPLLKIEPWWTVWFALWTALLLILARRYSKIITRKEKMAGLVIAGIATVPSQYAGWTSSTYSIMFWGAVCGGIGASLSWYLPRRGTKEDRELRRRIKTEVDKVEAKLDDLMDGKN